MNKSALRIKLLVLCIILGWGIVVYRLYTLQIKDNVNFQLQASMQQSYVTPVYAPRGSITSADGIELAIDVPTYIVSVYVPSIPHVAEFEQHVLPLLKGMSVSTFASDISNGINQFQIGWNISPSDKTIIEKAISSGDAAALQFTLTESRVYPNKTLLSDVLGYVDASTGSGEYGVEGYFDGDLKGVAGSITGDAGLAGTPIVNSNFNVIPSTAGENITLTVNAYLQQMVEAKLKQWVDEQNAQSGAVIIMNPKTGAIVSMAGYPSYDPNEYYNGYVTDCKAYMLATVAPCNGQTSKLDSSMVAASFNNPAISFVYEPGSVMKIITAAAALQAGKITPDTKFDDSNGVFKASGYSVYNYNKEPDGVMNMAQILKLSSNVGASMVSKLLGNQLMYQYYKAFGIGQSTGITLAGEQTGTVPAPSTWEAIDLATASFGQFAGATPLQVISVYQAIANGGMRMKPYIVQGVEKDEGQIVDSQPKEEGQAISSTTASELTQMLIQATTGEPNYGMTLFGLQHYMPEIASKTGTAQVPLPDKAGYYSNLINATYVGYAPATNPQFVMLTMLQYPRNSLYAATSAVPLWADIAKQLFLYYKIPPE